MSATAETTAVGFKPKKSVALSGTAAGNTALCTVGRTGNDLHYRGYDIIDIAETCEFEEIAYLLIHGKLPTAAELKERAKRVKASFRSTRKRTPFPSLSIPAHAMYRPSGDQL